MKVLIVEDEHLVRKGLISMMPWTEFGLEVVAEAANGLEAIPLIQEHQIELIITDLAMPKMSGLDLMRYVSEHYPLIQMVVLTFHQDFENIQTALRLGAIDYIAKVELEKEQMDQVLRRITNRIYQRKEDRVSSLGGQSSQQSELQQDAACLFLSVSDGTGGGYAPGSGELISLGEEVDAGMWFLPVAEQDFERENRLNRAVEAAQSQQWIVLRLSGVQGVDTKLLFPMLREYRSRDFFYDYNKEMNDLTLSFPELLNKDSLRLEYDLTSLREQWSSLHWVNDDQQFQAYVEQLERLRIPVFKLESLFYIAITRWERFASIPPHLKDRINHLQFWRDWLAWLGDIRSLIRVQTMKTKYAKDIIECIMRATEQVHADFSVDIKLKDIARTVGMSPSYMSSCFHDIVGKPFQDYVRDARIDYAKSLLRETNKPIYWIAAQTGYPNEKYFSKMFRELTGILPSEYRQRQ